MAKTQKALTISKLDAAKRQLETVIRLYFAHGDPVSIHTLTAAAYNILRDVTAKRGATPMLIKDAMFEFVSPEYKKMLKDKTNEAENFFKHADRDSESTLDFNPDMSEMLIIDVCAQYERLNGEKPPLFTIYSGWYMANYPDVFILPEQLKRIVKANTQSIQDMGRAAYFKTVLPSVMNLPVQKKLAIRGRNRAEGP